MKKVCFLLAVLLCSSSAVAQSLTEKTGLNSVFGVAPATADFLREAAISDQFEIQSSQLAQEERTASLQGFASRMITDHQATSGQLQEMVQNGDLQIDLPTALDSSHQEMLDRLRKLHGNNFVGRYRSDQISAHESAISFFQRYADSGDNMKLKSWAVKTLPILKSHLEMARALPQ